MRKDMGKIITEKPRRGSSARNAKTRMSIKWKGQEGDYDIPQKQSSSRYRVHGYNAKEFTDVLGPLYRYLDKQVGRPWNKVYSELCAFLDKRKVTHAHVFTHIDSYVEKDVYKGTDGLWHSRPYGGIIGDSYGRAGSGLYVNPKSGLICRQMVKAKERKKDDIDEIKIDDRNKYCRLEGIWYWIKYDLVDVDRFEFNRATKVWRAYTVKELRQVAKKQLNTKELSKAGLKNDPV